jgi:hypothetical protein
MQPAEQLFVRVFCSCVHFSSVLLPVLMLQGREVQLRLVQQRQKAAARAVNAKASRNVSKAKGKKARKTAAAMADW